MSCFKFSLFAALIVVFIASETFVSQANAQGRRGGRIPGMAGADTPSSAPKRPAIDREQQQNNFQGNRNERPNDRGGNFESQRNFGNQNRGGNNAGGNSGFGNPLLALFDSNRDGELSLAEMDAASRILREMDQNNDRRLTSNEINLNGNTGNNFGGNNNNFGNNDNFGNNNNFGNNRGGRQQFQNDNPRTGLGPGGAGGNQGGDNRSAQQRYQDDLNSRRGMQDRGGPPPGVGR